MKGRLDIVPGRGAVALAGALAAAFLLAGCAFVPPEEKAPAAEGESPSDLYQKLVWSDEFSEGGTGNAPNPDKWSYQTGAGGWGNNEKQTYTDGRANSYVDGGYLKIRAVKDEAGNWTSARIRSAGKGDWTYGYFEARIRVPDAKGPWPAFWMMPTDSAYGEWPRSGELDIMEYAPQVAGLYKAFSTVHYGTSVDLHVFKPLGAVTDRAITTGFHRYGLEWKPDSVSWYFDGKKIGNTYFKSGGDWTTWPFDRNFHFILNVAMGGNLGGDISPTLTAAAMEVDYVRVFR